MWGEGMTIFSIYYRYHAFCREKERNLEEAIKRLQYGEDYGELHSCGVIALDLQTAFVPFCLTGDGWIKEFNENKEELIGSIKEECGIDISGFVFERYPCFSQEELTS